MQSGVGALSFAHSGHRRGHPAILPGKNAAARKGISVRIAATRFGAVIYVWIITVPFRSEAAHSRPDSPAAWFGIKSETTAFSIQALTNRAPSFRVFRERMG